MEKQKVQTLYHLSFLGVSWRASGMIIPPFIIIVFKEILVLIQEEGVLQSQPQSNWGFTVGGNSDPLSTYIVILHQSHEVGGWE